MPFSLRAPLVVFCTSAVFFGLAACGDPAPAGTGPTSEARSAASRAPAASRPRARTPRSTRRGPDALSALGAVAIRRDATGAPVVVRGVGRLAAPSGSSPEAAARHHLARLAPAYGVHDRLSLELRFVRTLRGGGAIVGFRQRLDGIAIHRGDLAVHLRPDTSLVSVVGRLYDPGARSRGARFALGPASALTAAVRRRHGVDVQASARADKSAIDAGEWATLVASPRRDLAVTQARARRVFAFRDGRLEPAYAVEHFDGHPSTNDAAAYLDVVHAATGETLEQRDLTASDAFTYRVYADADGLPLAGPHDDPHPYPLEPYLFFPGPVAPTLHTVETRKTLPLGAVDPWLPAGATETSGNHADAYLDSESPDGLTGTDFRASVTGAGVFDHVYDLDLAPTASTTQQMAAITHAFYVVNTLHDAWYDAGFDEALGNAQADNYGRGGVAGDAMRVEVQDAAQAGSRDNANMSTPEDGSHPRMQIYLWRERRIATVQMTSPAGVEVHGAPSTFGPQAFEVTGVVAIADDGVDAPNDACTAVGSLAGKVALVDRGTCNFVDKVLNAEASGAIGVIVVNDRLDTPTAMGGTGSPTIPAVLVPTTLGDAIRAELASGAVQARLYGEIEPNEREGAIDATLVQHEWGHYLHHRLADCAEYQCSAMSEGWGDFVALHAQLRAGDDPAGAYAVAAHATNVGTDAAYFGLRRAPYSTDPAKNAFTFRHIAAGEALPTTHPLQRSGSPDNFEVHNAGEIWTAMLFDAYAAVLEAHPFAEAKQRFGEAVVASLLLNPSDATFVEARDALIEAMAAIDPADAVGVAEAFADRGLGTCAVAPDRTSEDFVGLVESFELSSDVRVLDLELDDGISCDDDGIVDAAEQGVLRVTVVNVGPVDAAPTVTVSAGAALVFDQPSRTTDLPAFATKVLTFDVRVADGVVTATPVEVTASAEPASTCAAAPSAATLSRWLPVHADVRGDASTTTRFAAGSDEFDLTGEDAERIWSRVDVADSADGVIAGIDFGSPSDTSLVTPPMAVGDEPFVVTLTHRYAFESGDGLDWDGMVIEVSTDDGATWVDASTVSDLVYPGAIQSDHDDIDQALYARPAFVGTNAAYPDTDVLAIDFGAALAGDTVRLRFRIGTDAASGADGWELHELAVTGTTNLPFRALLDETDAGPCDTSPQPDAGVEPPFDGEDGGTMEPPPVGGDGGVTPPPPGGSGGDGCGCAMATGEGASGHALPLLVVGLVVALRRRRRPRAG